MKKTITLLTVLALMLTIFAACANSTDVETTGSTSGETPEETTVETTEEATESEPMIEGADKLLSAIWADFAEDEKYYVGGGDYDNMVDGDAGLVTNTDYMIYNLHLPEEMHAQVDEVASLIHGMNANSMTTAAYHLAAGTDASAFAQGIRDSIQGTQWMCGFPEQLYVATVGEYVIVSFGLTDNITAIETHTATCFPNVEILFNEPIEG